MNQDCALALGGCSHDCELSLATRYAALLRLSQALSVFRNGDDLCNFVVTELESIVNCEIIGILSYDKPTKKLTWLMFDTRKGRVYPKLLSWEESASRWVCEHQRPLVIPDVEQETRFPKTMDCAREQAIRSFCMFPLKTATRHIGTIYFGSAAQYAHSEEEVRFLSLVAGAVGMAVGNARYFEGTQVLEAQLRREKSRLKLLLDLTNCLVSNLRIGDVLRAIAESLLQIFQCDVAGLMLPEVGCEKRPMSSFFERGGIVVSETSFPWDKVFSCVLETGEAWSGDTKDIPLLGMHNSPYWAALPIKKVCGFPLASPNRVLGAVALGRLSENAFTADDLALLSEVAKQVAIAIENALAYGRIADAKEKLAQEKLYLQDEIHSELIGKEIIGESATFRSVLQKVETVASTDSTVLICGETGTGKELIARAIHDLSSRRAHPFVKLNCAAIPLGLLESELFGHERGSFTGAATQKKGKFEIADGGTLFLDEIGDMPLATQAKILRVLQEKEFERVGGSVPIRVDVRFIAATNKNLPKMIKEGFFREDLYFRLNVFSVLLPALRERMEDIPLLANYFLSSFKKTIKLSPQVLQLFIGYSWPGNIRELKNVLEQASVLADKDFIEPRHLPEIINRQGLMVMANNLNGDIALDDKLMIMEKEMIINALKMTRGIQIKAANILGINQRSLWHRIKKLNIDINMVRNLQ